MDILDTIDTVNSIGIGYNLYQSQNSQDVKKKELANNKLLCSKKLFWLSIKQILISIILPIILAIIFIILAQYFNNLLYALPILLIWFIMGIIYIIYLSTIKWRYIQYKINTSTDINPNNCGF